MAGDRASLSPPHLCSVGRLPSFLKLLRRGLVLLRFVRVHMFCFIQLPALVGARAWSAIFIYHLVRSEITYR